MIDSNRSHFSANMSRTNWGISEKTAHLFKILVEQYLEDGQPVSSSTIAENSEYSVSSATVRNNMAKLHALGLVSSPHTSAGRVPTQQGLRFYVDGLITYVPLESEEQQHLWEELNRGRVGQDLLADASHMLSEISQLAGLVTIPLAEQVSLRQVEFIQLNDNQVLAILVVNEREVQNRVIETRHRYTDIELRQAANYINDAFSGQSLQSIRNGVLASMSEDQTQINSLLQNAMDIASKAFAETDHDFVLAGESKLVNPTSSADEIKKLLDAFEHKSSIVHLLDACIDGEGVNLFIGHESGYEPFDDLSLVTAPYEVRGKVAGVIGVIGPTRMSYQRVVPLVDLTSRVLGQVLERSQIPSS